MEKGALVFPKMNFKADPCCWDMRARKTAGISVQCAYSRPEWLSNAGGMRQSPFAKQLAETPILFLHLAKLFSRILMKNITDIANVQHLN